MCVNDFTEVAFYREAAAIEPYLPSQVQLRH